MIANSYHKYPYVREALLTRNERYNAELEKLEQLAAEGKAYIVSIQSPTIQANGEIPFVLDCIHQNNSNVAF